MQSGKRLKKRLSLVETLQVEPDFNTRLDTLERLIANRISDRITEYSLDAPENALFLYADFSVAEYEWCFGQAAALVRQEARKNRTKADWALVFRKHRYLFLASLIGTSNFVQRNDRYWPVYWENLESEPISELESTIRNNTDWLLRNTKLRTFDDAEFGKANYVGRFIIHAGFPASHLEDVISAISRCLPSVDNSSDGSALGEDDKLRGIALKVQKHIEADQEGSQYLRRFIRLCPSVATDIFDCVTQVVVAYSQNPELFDELSAGDTNGLPDFLFQQLKDLLVEGGTATSIPSTVSTRRERGQIKWDGDAGMIMLELPSQSRQSTEDWAISIDGTPHTVSARKAARCAQIGIKPIFPIPTPWNEIIVSQGTKIFDWELTGFDGKNQALFFDKGGKLLQNQNQSRGTVIYVAAPLGAKVYGIYRSGERKVLGTRGANAIVNWPGWMVRRFDTAELFELQLSFAQGGTQVHAFGGRRSLEWIPAKEIDHILGVDLLPVYADSPCLQLPASSEDDIWRIDIYYILDGEKPEFCLSTEFYGSDYPEEYQVFPECEDAWIGNYEVRVFHNGLFRDQRTFNMAEGVEVKGTYQPTGAKFKYPPASERSRNSYFARFSNGIDKSMVLPPGDISDSKHNQNNPFTIETEDYLLEAILNPDRLEYQLPLNSETGWSHSFARVQSTDLDVEGKLRLRIPTRVENLKANVISRKHRTVAYKTSMSQIRGGVYECDFSSIFADLDKTEEYYFTVTWNWPLPEDAAWNAVPKAANSTLFSIQFSPLFAGATITDNTLTIHCSSRVEDEILAWAWPLNGLPDDVRAIDMAGNRGTLPTELVGRGPLLVNAKLDEFFGDVSMPTRPTKLAMLAEQPVFGPNAGSPEENFIVQLLADNDSRTLQQRLTKGLELYQHWTNVFTSHRNSPKVQYLQAGLSSLLELNSRDTLDALEHANLDASELPALLIGTGLVNKPFHTDNTDDAFGDIVWLDLLDELNDYTALVEEGADTAYKQREKDQTQRFLIENGGEILFDTLRKGACVPQQRFANDTVFLSSLANQPLVEIQEKRSELIDDHLVSISARHRVLAEVLVNKHYLSKLPFLRALYDHADSMEGFLKKHPPLLLIAARLKDLPTTLGKKYPQGDWMYVPYLSFIFTTVSRLYAAGLAPGAYLQETLPQLRADWAIIAKAVPELTIFDLVIAEAVALNLRSQVWDQHRIS